MDMYNIGDPQANTSDKSDSEDEEPKTVSVEDARKHLNDGNFARVLSKYMNTAEMPLMFMGRFPGTHAAMVLAAVGMGIGADISPEQRAQLSGVYKKCRMHKEGIEQMGWL